MRRLAIAAISLALAMAATPAAAAIEITTYTLDGAGTFKINHDTVADSYTLGPTNLVIDGVTWTEADSVLDSSGSPFELSGSQGIATDFEFFFDPLASSQTVEFSGHVVGAAFSGSAPLTITSVPEPAAWMIMLLGLGGVGLTMRRTRRLAAA